MNLFIIVTYPRKTRHTNEEGTSTEFNTQSSLKAEELTLGRGWTMPPPHHQQPRLEWLGHALLRRGPLATRPSVQPRPTSNG